MLSIDEVRDDKKDNAICKIAGAKAFPEDPQEQKHLLNSAYCIISNKITRNTISGAEFIKYLSYYRRIGGWGNLYNLLASAYKKFNL